MQQYHTARRMFITGGAGFIGSHLVDRFLDAGHRVTVFDNLTSGQLGRIESLMNNPHFRFIEGDLLDLALLEKKIQGHDTVWHLAANGDIRWGYQQTDLDLKQSVEATRRLLEAMRLAGIRDILFSSSGSVYGNTTIVPTPETAGPLLPLSLYAAAKIAAEGYISAFCSLFGLRGWIFRFGNVVGSRMNRGVIYDFIQKLRHRPDELEVLGDGMQDKPYFMVDDCIDGMLHAYELAPMWEEKPCDIFNLGTASTTRVTTIAKIIMEEMGLSGAQVRFTGEKGGWPGDQTQVHLSCEKMKSYGWQASRDSDEAVREAARLLIQDSL